jgi:hypothetical protein
LTQAKQRQVTLKKQRRFTKLMASPRRHSKICDRFGASSGESDWIGEGSYIVAILALLHSRNAREIVEEDMVKQNKRRKLLRKPLLYSYHMLCIPNRYKQKYNMASISGDDDPSQIRAHFCWRSFQGAQDWRVLVVSTPTRQCCARLCAQRLSAHQWPTSYNNQN